MPDSILEILKRDAPLNAVEPTGGMGLTLDATGKVPRAALPTLITGRIATDGSITAGTRFTVAKGAAGIYTITYTAAFTAAPLVIGGSDIAGDNANVTVTSAAGSATVHVLSASTGALTDHSFYFLATLMT